MLEQILELNRQAAARGEYEVAYHLLMAALHWADHSGNADVLVEIAAVAKAQGDMVERHQPPHHLSRHQAQTRGQTAVFDSFQAHVEAVRLRLHSNSVRRT